MYCAIKTEAVTQLLLLLFSRNGSFIAALLFANDMQKNQLCSRDSNTIFVLCLIFVSSLRRRIFFLHMLCCCCCFPDFEVFLRAAHYSDASICCDEFSMSLTGKKNNGRGKSPSTMCTIIHDWQTLFVSQKMAPHKLLTDVCNNFWAFLLPVSMTTHWHVWRLRTREGDKPCLLHCAKMPSLPSTAIHSQANTTQATYVAAKTQLSPRLQFLPMLNCFIFLKLLSATIAEMICFHQSKNSPFWTTQDTALENKQETWMSCSI